MKPTVGRIVHFVQNGVHHPALILKVWSDTCATLQVFPNGSDAITPGALDTHNRAHSVTQNEPSPCCGTVAEWSWHWPEREA